MDRRRTTDSNKFTEVYEEKLSCSNCNRNCEMTLLMDGCSVLYVEGDGCKKGQKYAYKEMRKLKVLMA
ncbi:hypothetical protein Q5O24_06200 [Eubacteriaceae bacterium ES3]|nr:hypothetical protein Q5O24_06200 [Eubacteriaceae bacterium ES3]